MVADTHFCLLLLYIAQSPLPCLHTSTNHAGLHGRAQHVFSLTKQTVSYHAGVAFARVNTVLLVVMVFVFVWTLCLVYVCCRGRFHYANVLVVTIKSKLTVKCCNDWSTCSFNIFQFFNSAECFPIP